MNTENCKYLQDNLTYLGFGKNALLLQQVEEQMKKEADEFESETEATFNNKYHMKLSLYFKKGGKLDLFYFTKYSAKLHDGDDLNQWKTQVFYIHKFKGVTLMEAYNLLCGRSVNKEMVTTEGRIYKAWIQLDFQEKDMYGNYKVRQYCESYGYDLERVLAKYPIREFQIEEQRTQLLKSLKKGNLQLVHFDRPNKTKQLLIASNPRYKTILIYRGPNNTAEIPKNEDSFIN